MKAIKLMLALIVVLLVVVIAMNVRDNGADTNDGSTDQGAEDQQNDNGGNTDDDGTDDQGGENDDDSDSGEDEENDMIRVTSLESGDKVTSPLTVTGEARGGWYFEASFPVKLLDASGNTIASGVATAQGDWKTSDFVPFTATFSFPAQPAGSTGQLVLEKDNPSGLPENADSLTINIKF